MGSICEGFDRTIIENLPHDIWVNVLMIEDDNTMAKMSRVCKAWNQKVKLHEDEIFKIRFTREFPDFAAMHEDAPMQYTWRQRYIAYIAITCLPPSQQGRNSVQPDFAAKVRQIKKNNKETDECTNFVFGSFMIGAIILQGGPEKFAKSTKQLLDPQRTRAPILGIIANVKNQNMNIISASIPLLKDKC